MANAEKSKLEVPWGTLLPLIAVLAGIIVQYKPVVSERPPAPGEKAVEVIAEQDVDARLWQDPLAVVRRAKEAEKTEAKPNRTIDTLAQNIADRAESDKPRHILLLAAMLDAGPYIEQGESRLRSRQAVLEALSEGKFVPADSEHIGFVTAQWPPENEAMAIEDGLLLPWERCEAVDKSTAQIFPENTSSIFVLWLPAANFNTYPLARFAALITWLTKHVRTDLRKNIDVKLIGPLNSTGLQNMFQEVRDWREATLKIQLMGEDVLRKQAQADKDKARNAALEGVWIISPRATMSNDALFYRPPPPLSKFESAILADQQVPLKAPVESVEREIEKSGPIGLRFIRTIATDDVVAGTLIDELKLRGINVPEKHQTKGDRIVILTEWDSPYGRSLATTFAAKASDQTYASVVDEPTNWPKCILSYRYLRGIDGRLPGEQTKIAGDEDKQKKQGADKSKPEEEATEGMDQSDYLRRLAEKLKKRDLILQGKKKGRIVAIGLLGADIYDKLMILRALRPEFPDAVFFTNNYDAHLERRADWSDVRNLVIVSPFGSTLPDGWQRNVAPFRDSIQTAIYAGTLVATGKMDEKAAVELTKHPKIFEVGRRGVWDLSSSSSNKTWFRDWASSSRVRWHVAVGFLALLALIGWISMSIVDRRLPKSVTCGCNQELESWWKRLRRVAEHCSTRTTLWLICGIPIIVVLVATYSQHSREPLTFFEGVSIWPSEMLRLVALLLAIHFMIKARSTLKLNEQEIAKRFGLSELVKVRVSLEKVWEGLRRGKLLEQLEIRSRWKNLRLGLTRWQNDPAKLGAQFDAEEAWQAYLRRNCFGPRFVRIMMLFLIYLAFSVTVFTLFPPINPPARGLTASGFDRGVLIPAVIGMMILFFYVFDALQLNSNFIRIFTRGVSKWAPNVANWSRRKPPLTDEELSRYHDILFVAQRTEAVAPLIWYPLVVLAVMFVARSSFFDNWTWPLSLILVFALNAMWAFGSAVFLRRAAEQLRATAIRNLELLRASSYLSAFRRRAFDELIAEIRGLNKGAFAPLSEQHFIRAILVPGGGLGLLAVVQWLLNLP